VRSDLESLESKEATLYPPSRFHDRRRFSHR
jgi:hypothetical protein